MGIASENYVPKFDDYLRIRMRTTGFNEESFKTVFGADGKSIKLHQPEIGHHDKTRSLSSNSHASNDQIFEKKENTTNKKPQIVLQQNKNKNKIKGVEHTFIFMDVGGQRAERKKWMNMLQDNIDAVVYIIAISEYDLMCFEDSTTLRMHEALNLFESVLQKGFMKGKTLSLFFNKYDLLVQKLKDETKKTIKDFFPQFPENKDPRDPVEVCEFIYDLFLAKYQAIEKNSNSVPHYHRTSALDTDQIESVMGDIQSDLIRTQLKMAGF